LTSIKRELHLLEEEEAKFIQREIVGVRIKTVWGRIYVWVKLKEE